MSTISEYYLQAELALASYSNLSPGMSGKDYTDALQNNGNGMTLTQAQDFSSNWNVIDQYDGTVEESYVDEFGLEHTFLNPTGLSVTLFEDSSGKQVIAVRGTNDLNDVITDVIDIGALGTSEYQAQYKALSAQVEKWVDLGDLHSGFLVTGHSLGGFLATNLTLEYSTDVTQTFIYNAPGVTGVGGNIIEAISSALSPDNPIALPTVLPVSNIVATDDIVSSVGLSVSTPIIISVDAQNPLTAHSIVGLTSSLCIYNLFSTISGSDNPDDFTPFLEKMPDEHALSVVNNVFQAGIDPTQVSVDLAIELTGYANDHSLTGLTVTSLHEHSAEALRSAAENDNAFLFALNALAGFAISGNQPGYVNLVAAEYSTQYLEDRSLFLYQTMHEDTLSPTGDDMQFCDTTLGIDAYAGNGVPDFTDRHYIFGNLEGELIVKKKGSSLPLTFVVNV
ncbi:hypothetical protein UWK_03219 [Desulfocapsa sulfexigens DSM 10523]|uniref:Lipase (Class 3) n=1 Tax=Desulfocapsa sulfexigens (strain DSM 10523 / SB164P1) TaxID=1167006 RepID=M1PTR5_DESSD|nr:hypothetical protein [Desulfocapsa sulfexigens]AGF79746.1 hypothetical protein UWK_03219 [Desulfocapsa sulfexigens DSM 10523]